MIRLRTTLPGAMCALAAQQAAALDLVDSTFGDQPVAIGAGARALGMGGAFSAVADDATASTWNPAGLTQCERPELSLSVGFNHAMVRSGSDEDGVEYSLRPEHLSGMLPFFALGCQQVVGVAWQRTYDFTRELNSAGVQQSIDEFGFAVTTEQGRSITRSGSFATVGLCYAIEPTPGLSVGVTLNQWSDVWTRASHYRQDSSEVSNFAIDLGGFTLVDDRTIDSSSRTRVTAGTSVVLGTWWQALPALTLAVVVKPGYTLDLETDSERTETIDDGSGFPPLVESTSTSATSTLHHPASATVGSAWRSDDVSTVTCDATWTRWRGYYTEQDGVRRSPINGNLDPSEFRDLWTLRAGYERILILPTMVLVPRCGALAEWLPAATAAPSLFAVDQVSATSDLWLGLTAGLSLCQRSTIWDAAIQVRRGDNVGAGQYTDPDRTADVTITSVRLGLTQQF